MFQRRLKGTVDFVLPPVPAPWFPGKLLHAPAGLGLVCVVCDRKLRLSVNTDELWDFLDYSECEFGD